MPSKELIQSQLDQLSPTSRRRHKWTGDEYGGHFELCRHNGFLWNPQTRAPIPATGYALSISGPDTSERAILADFVRALGHPRLDLVEKTRRAFLQARQAFSRAQHSIRGNMTHYYTWLQSDGTEDDSSLPIIAYSPPINAPQLEQQPGL